MATSPAQSTAQPPTIAQYADASGGDDLAERARVGCHGKHASDDQRAGQDRRRRDRAGALDDDDQRVS
jgi:hypothetical protein